MRVLQITSNELATERMGGQPPLRTSLRTRRPFSHVSLKLQLKCKSRPLPEIVSVLLLSIIVIESAMQTRTKTTSHRHYCQLSASCQSSVPAIFLPAVSRLMSPAVRHSVSQSVCPSVRRSADFKEAVVAGVESRGQLGTVCALLLFQFTFNRIVNLEVGFWVVICMLEVLPSFLPQLF